MNLFRSATTALLTTLLFATPILRAQSPTPADDPLLGSWQGTLVAGPQKLELALHVQRADDGSYTGTFDSLTQGAKDIPVASITLDDDAVVVDIAVIRGRFEATLRTTDDGRELVGTWKQGPADLPLTLRAVDQVVELERPQTPKPPFPYRVEEVRFGHDPAKSLDDSFTAEDGAPVTLAGTLTLPEGDGPFAAAVMITGSGPQDRDETIFGHKPFAVIADHLTRAGLAVLRYDDRGFGESTGSFSSSTSNDFAADARAAVRFLGTRDDIDTDRIGLIGHSEGGLIAPIVASGPDSARIAFSILIAPPGVPIDEIILHQGRLIASASGAAGDDLDTNQKLLEAVFSAVREHENEAERTTAVRAAAEAAWKDFSPAARTEVGGSIDGLIEQTSQIDRPWMRWLLDHDPAEALRGMHGKILVLFAEKDLQVDPAQNRSPIEAALDDHSPAATVLLLEGLNHLLQRSTTGAPSEYSSITETIDQSALDTLSDWIRAHVLERENGG